ncbi:MAG: glycine--tRNA ligase subunit beta [Simkaniaceae bacterium]|nr:glycine--tRNA ligase subunit beta [Simkaniaceae bacterium]
MSPSFQQTVRTLHAFWQTKGCLVGYGHDVEVGAGTFNPATFLRAVGPEPFNIVYVEPSRRPQDGRYGDNPHRLHFFHQLQVVMKPSPDAIRRFYLESLEALGIDRKVHDIRFVHDDWESPTLGAWGLGWEVWLNGMEITQFTYFQSVAGYALRPVTVEITYGLERLCMNLQKKHHLFDIMWNDSLSYGDICLQGEREWSRYNFDHASVAMWRRHFEDFAKESRTLSERDLPLPAYDFAIKASHAFNILEARGVLSVAERTGYVTRVRELAKGAAKTFLAIREREGFPLCVAGADPDNDLPPETSPPPLRKVPEGEREDFLLEIGSEELPAGSVRVGCHHLKQSVEALLREEKLPFDRIDAFGSPGRLAVLVHNLASATSPEREEKKGPPLALAFDERGVPTPQGTGFFRSTGVAPRTLPELREAPYLCPTGTITIRLIKNKEYLIFETKKSALPTEELLRKRLPECITSLRFPKKMRWGNSSITYARPIHTITALLGSRVIPFSVGSVLSSDLSTGHTQRSPGPIRIKKATDYVETLRSRDVLVDIEERKRSILTQLRSLTDATDTLPVERDRVLEEVLFLSEWPTLCVASFDRIFLEMPKEILISEMVYHRRYFPLANRDGSLSDRFVITADNRPDKTIKEGNSCVLTARLADGKFLYENDLRTSLDTFAKELHTITFCDTLGTMADKTERMGRIALLQAQSLHLDKETVAKIARACELAKADLATSLVREFPVLQGVIGEYYALHGGEEPETAGAVRKHLLPRFEADELPTDPVSYVTALADKLHDVVGYCASGRMPSSSGDPYGVRRHVFGIIRILIENNLHIDLADCIGKILPLFPGIENPDRVKEELHIFIVNRLQHFLEGFRQGSFAPDEIRAVASATIRGIDPYDRLLRTEALNRFRKTEDFAKLHEIYKRAKGQLEGRTDLPEVREGAFREDEERVLYRTLGSVASSLSTSLETRDYIVAFESLLSIRQPLSKFFDALRILAPDPAVRRNRLAMLRDIVSLFRRLSDFDKIRKGRG